MGIAKLLLLPFSFLYGLLMMIRNLLFDWNILKSREYELPIISVGNLCMGGTGKTPHVEYLVRLLKDNNELAILSRGYKRKTSGFLLAGESTTEEEIGDEPLQYVVKFPDIRVAVDRKRNHGIQKLLKEFPDLDAIIMDDAFQHRYVKPGISILLTDFHNLYKEDYVFPSGHLREFRRGSNRADIIIISKCPSVLSPITRRRLVALMEIKSHQKLFFSHITYSKPKNIAATGLKDPPKNRYNNILLFTGIANPYPLKEFLSTHCRDLITIEYPDHHRYTMKDLAKILDQYESIIGKDKAIFTTEKDAMRLNREEFGQLLEGIPVYYVPIEVAFHQCDDSRFDKMVKKYVEKDRRSSKVHQAEMQH
jgi:tetraacyldisaccharide 4'-kinase